MGVPVTRPPKEQFIEVANRRQATLFCKCLDDWIDESNQFARSICSSMSCTGRARLRSAMPALLPASEQEQRNEFQIAQAAQHGRPIVRRTDH